MKLQRLSLEKKILFRDDKRTLSVPRLDPLIFLLTFTGKIANRHQERRRCLSLKIENEQIPNLTHTINIFNPWLSSQRLTRGNQLDLQAYFRQPWRAQQFKHRRTPLTPRWRERRPRCWTRSSEIGCARLLDNPLRVPSSVTTRLGRADLRSPWNPVPETARHLTSNPAI